MKRMYTLRTFFGVIAILFMAFALAALFAQPFATGVANNRLFALLTLLGLVFVLFFLFANRMIVGTIYGGRNRTFFWINERKDSEEYLDGDDGKFHSRLIKNRKKYYNGQG
jgi:hypothetical protein